MDIVAWIEQNMEPKRCDSEAFFYNEMESQSYYCLPVIYQPFDPANPAHWSDRGSLYDFLHSVDGEGKTLLDFGPGDGWPSLIVAPFAGEVIGVDGSPRRVEVCEANARRLGITNARFMHVTPGCPLPFPDASVDGVMASTSIEQTPDPKATLGELFRVLRPGGRLRISYEALNSYQGGQEHEVDVEPAGTQSCWLTFYDRHIEQEVARMAKLKLSVTEAEAVQTLSPGGETVAWDAFSTACLAALRGKITEARICTLRHPSTETFLRWMQEIGFQEAYPTHSGAWFAWRLFSQLAEGHRPTSLEGIDDLLSPLVRIVVQMRAPVHGMAGRSPMITAVK